MPIEIVRKKLCNQPATIPRIFDPGVSSLRMGYILSSGLKWVNGTEIKFMFLEGAEPQKKVVRRAFQFQHEHQSPYAGIEWNTPAVYAEFSGPPNNWPKDQIDAKMVISEKAETENYYLSGDDDSGLDKNSKITLPLVKGRDYLVNLRVMFTPGEQSGSVIVS